MSWRAPVESREKLVSAAAEASIAVDGTYELML